MIAYRFLRTILFMLVTLLPVMAAGQGDEAQPTVLPGIDVLAGRNFDLLHGKRVGLITNQTGRSIDGQSSIDILYHAPGVRLTALFSPEHGIRGIEDRKLSSTIDLATGLPVHSLYGATCRPTPEMLQEVDMLVFDIQDIGARFYTYIGTLSLAMEAAARAGIPFVVLDRPNPIGGELVQGAIPEDIPLENGGSRKEKGCRELTSIHPVPTRHGMTIGELARLFNGEFGIGCDLRVIPMQGWQRGMYLDETGLEWINPSPNMRSLEAALLYPGLGILESSNISVGRGTEQPFSQYGAPWVDAKALLANLEQRRIPGVEFAQCSFVPLGSGHPYKGKTCFGVSVTVIDRDLFDPVLTGMHLLQALAATHPKHFFPDSGFDVQVGDSEVWGLLTTGHMTPQAVMERWREDLRRFGELRGRYLLY